MSYTMIDGKWPEPTKTYFKTYTDHRGNRRHAIGPFFEDMHWWWRHLPKNKQYIPPKVKEDMA